MPGFLLRDIFLLRYTFLLRDIFLLRAIFLHQHHNPPHYISYAER